MYTALLADALTRWYQLMGAKALLSTGTDEHGLKVRVAPRLCCGRWGN
jgi:methionyl-tRNA synthetase